MTEYKFVITREEYYTILEGLDRIHEDIGKPLTNKLSGQVKIQENKYIPEM